MTKEHLSPRSLLLSLDTSSLDADVAPGDHVAIFPHNPTASVARTLAGLGGRVPPPGEPGYVQKANGNAKKRRRNLV